jgi:hypothetical protein
MMSGQETGRVIIGYTDLPKMGSGYSQRNW